MCRKESICRGMSTKWICCSLINLTIGCRIIGSIGIMISLWMVIVFANDKFLNSDSNYDVSRKTAIFLGLEWEHFHKNASIKEENDPEGRMISIVLIFYSFSLLGVNLLLVIATLRYDWCFALAWLMFEALSCLSKFGSFIFQFINDSDAMGSVGFVGSIFTLIVSLWWWWVVLFATISWKNQKHFNLECEMISMYNSTFRRNDVTENTLDEILPARICIYENH